MSNLPSNQRDVEENKPIYTTVKGHKLTHYALAERLIQWEYRCIMNDVKEDPTSEALIYILEGGFRGFHKFTANELINEYGEIEWDWYKAHKAGEFHWPLFEEDPLSPDYESDLEKKEAE
jgi:hypothetical protein|tara:strand:+ start:111 stop:470 length:360 start_codon:yes stop_codon:yes gene_type:complete